MKSNHKNIMESRHDFAIAPGDHEPHLTKLCCSCNKVLHIRMGRFMERMYNEKI